YERISASRLGNQFWHPSCFSCHFCHQPLQSILQATSRLAGCLEHGLFPPPQLIFMEECIEAEGRRWHLDHFCCLECDVP
uniref:LIM zinc-binding domain-containing protein n=1 Tax=Buteo japonicus TaxID=224669 RepID=A0A8C0BET4_9AVES